MTDRISDENFNERFCPRTLINKGVVSYLLAEAKRARENEKRLEAENAELLASKRGFIHGYEKGIKCNPHETEWRQMEDRIETLETENAQLKKQVEDLEERGNYLQERFEENRNTTL